MGNTFLRDLRKETGERQIDIANLLGLKTSATYCKKENGQVPVSLKDAQILAEHFKIPLGEFVTNLTS